MAYSQAYRPKRALKTFRDLDVYRRAMECAVLTIKSFQPALIKLNFSFTENMVNCSVSIPLNIGESNSLRYSNFNLGIATLEKAMASCNKMIVYYEYIVGIYGKKINNELAEDLMGRYLECRNKMFRLEKAWVKYYNEYKGEKIQKIPASF